MQATFFRVAEEEMQASQELVSHDAVDSHGRPSSHHADANLVRLLSGGVLLVRSALVVAASSPPGGAFPMSHGIPDASATASAALEQQHEFESELCRIHKGERCDIEGADPLLLGQPRYAKYVRHTTHENEPHQLMFVLWSAITTMQFHLHCSCRSECSWESK